MPSLVQSEPATSLPQRTERGCRRLLWACSIVAAVALLCHLALLLWAQNAFSGQESVVTAQSHMLAQNGTLYYDLNSYPYTVCAYTPLFYILEAGLSKTGLPPMTAGRLISFAALLGTIVLSWRLLMVYTSARYCAWIGALLVASTCLFATWGTAGQVDTLAVFFAIAAFYFFSRGSLLTAGVFAGVAFFTKQTMLACPAAIFVALCLDRPKIAVRFGAILAGSVAAIALAINFATGGHFLADIVRANMNPLDLGKVKLHALVLIGVSPMILIAALGMKQGWRAGRALFIYLSFAAAVFVLTAAKIGSDTNYQIEFTIVLILCACVVLHALHFFPLSFSGSKRWITLLQIPLAVHLLLNFRMTANLLLTRVGVEQQFRSEIDALRPYLADGGPLLSTDYNATARLRGDMQVEPLIYGWMVRSGTVDPEPLQRDLAAHAFSTILLFDDIFLSADAPDAGRDLETPTFTRGQLEAIRKNYRLAARVESPYPSGVFVYKPIP